jgi:hypothetical protein
MEEDEDAFGAAAAIVDAIERRPRYAAGGVLL